MASVSAKLLPLRRVAVSVFLAGVCICYVVAFSKNFLYVLQMVDGNAHLVEEERPETLTSDRKVKLVLVTMFRGGSSFLGELFKNNPDVLYWFEPTNPLFMSAIQEYHLYGDSGTFHLEEDNITCRKLPEAYFTRLSTSVKGLLDCNITQVDSRVFLKNTFMTFNKLEPLVAGHERRATIDPELKNILRQNCLAYSYVVIKCIRLSLYMMRSLLDGDPDYKIIYYVRDPRAIINSRLQYQKALKTVYDLDKDIAQLCCRMRSDHADYEDLLRQHRRQILLLKFEDLARQPLAVAENIYSEYLGLDMPASVRYWIGNSTSQQSRGLFSTTKVSAEIVDKWKKELSPSVRLDIEWKCHDILKVYGYI